MSCKLQFSRLSVDTKYHNGVAVLVCCQQKRSGGIDRKVAWRLSAGRFVANKLQFAAIGMYLKNHQTVVTAIRAV